MPESRAVTQKIANTRAVPAMAVASGLAMIRCTREIFRTRSSGLSIPRRLPPPVPAALSGAPAIRLRRSDIRSAVLPGELLDLADVLLGHEAGAGADMPGSVHRGE